MKFFRTPFLISYLFVALAVDGPQQKNNPLVIEGKVIEEVTGKPVVKAHVFILDGEEEALTNINGEFRIESWQKAPLKLTVDNYNNYRRTTVVVSDPARKQVIRLKIK
jgi:hypothetical protein